MKPFFRQGILPLVWIGLACAGYGCEPERSGDVSGGGDVVQTQPMLDESPESPEAELEQTLQETGESTEEDEMVELEGTAGSPSGPGVEPPETDEARDSTTDPEVVVDETAGTGAAPSNAGGDLPGASGTGAAGAAGTGGGMTASPPLECVLAVRLDSCCQQAVAATVQEVEADECLVEFDRNGKYPQPVVDTCFARIAAQCTATLCELSWPPSLAVVADASGMCSFADECQSAADCAIASDHENGCACPRAWPRSFVDAHECIIEPGQQLPAQCPQDAGLLCLCSPPWTPQCVEEAGLRACR